MWKLEEYPGLFKELGMTGEELFKQLGQEMRAEVHRANRWKQYDKGSICKRCMQVFWECYGCGARCAMPFGSGEPERSGCRMIFPGFHDWRIVGHNVIEREDICKSVRDECKRVCESKFR